MYMTILHMLWGCWVALGRKGSGLGVGGVFWVLDEEILGCAGLFWAWVRWVWVRDFWVCGGTVWVCGLQGWVSRLGWLCWDIEGRE